MWNWHSAHPVSVHGTSDYKSICCVCVCVCVRVCVCLSLHTKQSTHSTFTYTCNSEFLITHTHTHTHAHTHTTQYAHITVVAKKKNCHLYYEGHVIVVEFVVPSPCGCKEKPFCGMTHLAMVNVTLACLQSNEQKVLILLTWGAKDTVLVLLLYMIPCLYSESGACVWF